MWERRKEKAALFGLKLEANGSSLFVRGEGFAMCTESIMELCGYVDALERVEELIGRTTP
jgi:hypothetical protein